MSEQILDRAGAGEQWADGAGEKGSTSASRNRTFLIVALAALGGLVLGGIVLFFMRPGGEPLADAEATVVGGGTSGSTATADPGAAASDNGQDPATTTPSTKTDSVAIRLTSRDPFAPLVVAVIPPTTTKKSTSDSSKAAETSTTTATTTKTGGTISAMKISAAGDSVSLKLDGKRYTVDEGETFAKVYRLYDIFNESCAGFLYGDQNSVVCEGDTVQMG